MAITIVIAAIPEDDDDDDDCDIAPRSENAKGECEGRLSFKPRDVSISHRQLDLRKNSAVRTAAKWSVENEDSDDESDSDEENESISKNPLTASSSATVSTLSAISLSSSKKPSLSAVIRQSSQCQSTPKGTRDDVEMTSIT
jgi:hypothetical protein